MTDAVVQLSKFSAALESPMVSGAIPADESERLRALIGSKILSDENNPVFDRITRNLARIFDAPIALLTFIDSDKQFFKAQVGLPEELRAVKYVPRQTAVCSHVVATNTTLVVRRPRAGPPVCQQPDAKIERAALLRGRATPRGGRTAHWGNCVFLTLSPANLTKRRGAC